MVSLGVGFDTAANSEDMHVAWDKKFLGAWPLRWSNLAAPKLKLTDAAFLGPERATPNCKMLL